jgi:hypothetical protein
MKTHRWLAFVMALVLLVGSLSTVLAAPAVPQVAQVKTSSLVFDVNDFTEESVLVGDETITFRAYRDVVYVKNPVIATSANPFGGPDTPPTVYQKLNVFVPAEISLEEYKTDDTPIFFPNSIGGYMPGLPLDTDKAEVQAALAEGYVVVAPGARGRTNYDPDTGEFNGKAPAAIVDLKAAVRYLRFNDKIMPGDAEKIISSGTSAGGAVSTLLGATGNNKDYEPYLRAIGAAREKDHIFATNAYCPITNLDNSDTAYEWQFYGINDYYFLGGGTMTGDQLIVSEELKDMFPAYLNSLKLYAHEPRNGKGKGLSHAPGQVKKGVPLRLDANGEGTFKDYVKAFIIDSAQTALDNGTDLSGFDWITIEDGTVTDLDWDEYLLYEQRMKPAPAFDGIYFPSWENNLFGTATVDNQHFTQYSYETPYSEWEAPLADWDIVKMMNPMYYIDARGGRGHRGRPNISTTSHYWRIRHGAVDADTSVAIPVMLATKLMNTGHDVDFAVPWDQGHGGNYDLEQLFDWIEAITTHKGGRPR